MLRKDYAKVHNIFFRIWPCIPVIYAFFLPVLKYTTRWLYIMKNTTDFTSSFFNWKGFLSTSAMHIDLSKVYAQTGCVVCLEYNHIGPVPVTVITTISSISPKIDLNHFSFVLRQAIFTATPVKVLIWCSMRSVHKKQGRKWIKKF